MASNPFDAPDLALGGDAADRVAASANPFDAWTGGEEAFATAGGEDDPYALLVKMVEKSPRDISPRGSGRKTPRNSDLALKRGSDLSKRGSDLAGKSKPPLPPTATFAVSDVDNSAQIEGLAPPPPPPRDSSMDWEGTQSKETKAGVVKKLTSNVNRLSETQQELSPRSYLPGKSLGRSDSPTGLPLSPGAAAARKQFSADNDSKDGFVDWAATDKKKTAAPSLARKLSSSLLRKASGGVPDASRGRAGSHNSLDDIGETVYSSGAESDSSEDDNEAGGLPFGDADPHDLSGRNRIMQFMESVADVESGKVQCVLVLVDDLYELYHLSSRRVWMKAKRRSDGMKNFLPGEVHFAIWLTPLLLVESMKGSGEDDSMSLTDLLRQLDTVEVFENDLKTETPLRLGKLRGNTSRGVFHLWGTGKNGAKASGAMDARPEFACLKLEARSTAALVLPNPAGARIRPLKKHEWLWARAEKTDRTVQKIVGVRSANLCEWEDGKTLLRVSRTLNEDKKLLVEFCGVSPLQAFGVALACAGFMGVKAPSSRGSLQNLLTASSRKSSTNDMSGKSAD